VSSATNVFEDSVDCTFFFSWGIINCISSIESNSVVLSLSGSMRGKPLFVSISPPFGWEGDVKQSEINCRHFMFYARIQTACELIERIGNQRGELVQNIRRLCEAYIELAYINVAHLKNERGTMILHPFKWKMLFVFSLLRWPAEYTSGPCCLNTGY